MAETFKFELVSPERLLMSGDVKSVKVPGSEGDFLVLPDHAPFMSTLRPGVLIIDGAEGEARYFVKAGFADVSPSGFTLLAEFATEVAKLKGDVLAQELKDAEAAVEVAHGDEAKRQAHELVSSLQALA